MKLINRKMVGFTAVAAVCLLPALAQSQVRGQCADCHTMHNSQNGEVMAVGGPHGMLLTGDCIGCHTNTTDGSGRGGSSDNIPFVHHTSAPDLGAGGMLAGGSFYWVLTDDSKGHNVLGIAGADGNFVDPLLPPGGIALDAQLTCAGTNGCHGDRTVEGDYAALSGAHHAAPKLANAASGYMDGDGMANSYRFLLGVKGIESPDWEALQDPSTRNVYYGIDRSADTQNDAATISSLCGQCHGDYHANAAGQISASGTMSSPWVRHPTDFDMVGIGGEYADYEYSMEAPVASSNIDNTYTRPNPEDIMNTPGDAIVTCISCHRAHGSAHDDLLRWDYSSMQAHDAGAALGTGCFRCHTTKDS